MSLFQALINTVLPVFILAGLGWVARVVLKADVKDPATISVYILTPGLLMNSVLTTHLMAGEIGKIILFALALTAVMILATLLTGRLLGWTATERNAAVLSTAFMNSANYGLPVTLLAFGQAGFDRAAVFAIVESLLMYSVAVFFAARGRLNWRQALSATLRLPLAWAAAAAVLVRLAGIQLPDFILKPIGLLANGALAVVILVLGMQVAGIRLKGARVKITMTALMRLLLSPLVGLALIEILHPDPLTGKVMVLEACMPAAINTTLLAVQFDAEPDQVSGSTLVSTLLSLITVTFWVWFLK